MKIFIASFCLWAFCFSVPAQTKVVPILEMNVRGLLGGVENGKWLNAAETAAKLKGGVNYTLYGIEGVNEGETKITIKDPAKDDPCDDFYFFEMEDEAVTGVALGDGYRWDPMPRAPKAIDLNSAAYKKIVADVLRTKKITKTTIKLTQAVRIDLEGDGKEEVLITATFFDSGNIMPSAKRGNYSFVMIRRIVGKAVQNTVVDGEFYTKNVEFGAPNEYKISAIADLNGDGKMEIIMHSAYYEGSSSWVYEMKNGKATEVKALSIGCGV
jgi:uncharacterized protein (DUF2141 family)